MHSGSFATPSAQRSTRCGEEEWQFSGSVDFSGGLAAFSDEGVAAQFGGAALGQYLVGPDDGTRRLGHVSPITGDHDDALYPAAAEAAPATSAAAAADDRIEPGERVEPVLPAAPEVPPMPPAALIPNNAPTPQAIKTKAHARWASH